MHLPIRISLLAALVFPVLLSAQSRTALAIAAGPSIPIGALRGTQSTGSDMLIGLVRGSDGTPIGLRLDFSYDRLRGKSVSGTTAPERRIAAGTLDFVLSFAGYSFKPYVIGGVGGFKITTKPASPDSKTRLGYDFGLGFTLPVGSKAVFLEGRVNSVTQPNKKPARYIPIVLGFLF